MNSATASSGARSLRSSVLEAQALSKAFGEGSNKVTALDKVSLQLRPGEITGLIGPDGAGKTTLMRVACGILPPDEGTVLALGIDVHKEPLRAQAEVRYMPQRFSLYEDLSVRENLNLYSDLQGLPRAERKERYAYLLRMTGLSEFMARPAGKLSGGMKQKLGIACALLRAPRILLLDEPTVGVDPVSRRELWAILEELVGDHSVTVLMSTAYLDEAEHFSEVILLNEGKVLGQGPPEQFSAPLEGQTWLVNEPHLRRRVLAERLAHASGTLDVVVQGESVRLVTKKAEANAPTELVPDLSLTVEATPPRFEDGFIALVKGGRDDPPLQLDKSVLAPERRGSTSNGRIIQVKGLERRFGDFYAVRDLTFDVKRGEIFGLLGANGAGKSTTFRMLCGLLPPSAGELEVAGVDLRTAPAHARESIGYMAQKFSLYGNLTIRQNLSFFASAYGIPRGKREERVSWALDEFRLEALADVKSETLPLGFKQRLAMAAVLLHRPEILFLDEPTSGVDPLARREFWRRINALVEAGVTALVTTHFMEEAEYCDRLVIMAAGRVLELGSPSELKERIGGADGPVSTMEEAFVRLIEQAQEA